MIDLTYEPDTITETKADILVVDDTPDNVRFLSKILAKYGYSVRKAINGTMALTAVQTQQPDLILLDIRMPDLDGYEVCQRLKSNADTAAIPIIFLSAWSETADKVKAFKTGGVDYITKPFQFEEVIARIETQLTIRKLQTQLEQQNIELRKTIQELHQTQAQLVQEQKIAGLGQFVAGVCHEINNPIGFIACNIPPAYRYVQQLSQIIHTYQAEYPTPSSHLKALIDEVDLEFALTDLQKIFQSIHNGTKRIQHIVEALRIFSRLDEAEFKAIDIHQGIDSALALLGHRIETLETSHSSIDQVVIHKEYGNLPLVTCNARYINQAIFNLLDNALNALEAQVHADKGDRPSPWQPTIWIQTYMDHHHDKNSNGNDLIVVRLKDNGIGIAADHVSKIFDPFFQDNQNQQDKNLGLGLHTAYQIIVEQHGGQLLCNSSHHEGTEFVIYLPTEPQTAPNGRLKPPIAQ